MKYWCINYNHSVFWVWKQYLVSPFPHGEAFWHICSRCRLKNILAKKSNCSEWAISPLATMFSALLIKPLSVEIFHSCLCEYIFKVVCCRFNSGLTLSFAIWAIGSKWLRQIRHWPKSRLSPFSRSNFQKFPTRNIFYLYSYKNPTFITCRFKKSKVTDCGHNLPRVDFQLDGCMQTVVISSGTRCSYNRLA